MERRWILPALLVTVVMVLIIGGALYFTRDTGATTQPATVEPTAIATPTHAPPTTSAPEVMSNHDVVIYYLGDGASGSRLFTETHQVSTSASPTKIAIAAANAALSEPPVDGNYRNPWPAGLAVDQITAGPTASDPISVHFSSAPTPTLPPGMSSQDANLAVAALARTVRAALDSTSEVQLFDGNQVMPTVFGQPADHLDGGNDADVLALVQITSPTEGSTEPAGIPFVVSGEASAFEANVVWQVTNSSGTVVRHGVATAAQCCTLSPYSFSVTLPVGKYTVLAHDTSESGSGGAENSDSKQIVVQ